MSYERIKPGHPAYPRVKACFDQGEWICDAVDHNEPGGCPNPECFNYNDNKPDRKIKVERATGDKCTRCWKMLPEVGEWADLPDLCLRCVDAVLHQRTGIGLHETAMQRFDQVLVDALATGAASADAVAAACDAARRNKT